MPSDQTLTDEQLLAVAQSGDSSLLRALNPDEKNRLIALSQQPTPRSSAAPLQPFATRGPHGLPTDERGQEYDPKTLQPYQPGLLQRGVDYVSNVLTHPTPGMQLAGDVAALAAGRFAGGMRPGAMDTQNELTLRGQGLSGYARAGMQKLADLAGLDSDARDIKALRTQQQALRSSAKQIKTAGDIAARQAPAPQAAPAPLTAEQLAAQASVHNAPVAPEAPIPTQGMPDIRASSQGVDANARAATARAANPRTATTSPAAAAPAGSAATAPASATQTPVDTATARLQSLSPETVKGLLKNWAGRASIELTPQELDSGAQMVQQGSKPSEVVDAIARLRGRAPSAPVSSAPLSREEGRTFQQLVMNGKSPQDAMRVIDQARAVRGTDSFAGLPGPDEAAAQAQDRAATSEARSTRRGKPTP